MEIDPITLCLGFFPPVGRRGRERGRVENRGRKAARGDEEKRERGREIEMGGSAQKESAEMAKGNVGEEKGEGERDEKLETVSEKRGATRPSLCD